MESTLSIEGSGFGKDDLQLLISIISLSLIDEAKWTESFGTKNNLKFLFMDEGDSEVKKRLYKAKKMDWVSKWTKKILESLQISRTFDSSEVKREFRKIISNERKKSAFIVEISSFEPYFDFDEHSISKELNFNENDKDNYFRCCYAMTGIEQVNFNYARDKFNSCIKEISKAIAGKNHAWSILTIGVLVATLLIDPIGSAIGAAMELSGAAALSAGLAFLGGGAIAAGGLGMQGGIIVIMAGGAILGFGSGSAEYDQRLKACSKEQLLLYCAKLYSLVMILNISNEEIIQFCSQVFTLQSEYEKSTDEFALSGQKDTSNVFEEKVKIISAFRKMLRNANQRTWHYV